MNCSECSAPLITVEGERVCPLCGVVDDTLQFLQPFLDEMVEMERRRFLWDHKRRDRSRLTRFDFQRTLHDVQPQDEQRIRSLEAELKKRRTRCIDCLREGRTMWLDYRTKKPLRCKFHNKIWRKEYKRQRR